eukprot:299555-Pyramimonas_sp.AAC.1
MPQEAQKNQEGPKTAQAPQDGPGTAQEGRHTAQKSIKRSPTRAPRGHTPVSHMRPLAPTSLTTTMVRHGAP